MNQTSSFASFRFQSKCANTAVADQPPLIGGLISSLNLAPCDHQTLVTKRRKLAVELSGGKSEIIANDSPRNETLSK